MSNFQTIDDEEIEQSVLVTDVTALKSQIALTSSSNMKTAIDANTSKTGITNQQALDIASNNLKTGITNTQAALILSNEDDIETTDNRTQAIKASASDSLTIGDSSHSTNDLIIGEISDTECGIGNKTFTAGGSIRNMISQTNAGVVKIGAMTGDNTIEFYKAGSKVADVGDIVANTAKTGITSGQASAIVANTAKTGITSGQASAIVANTAKTGISSGQASAIVANTAKTGISTDQANAITANTAKTSFPTDLNNLLSVSDTYELEVGNNAGIPRIRLRGQNGQAISSELIFIDAVGNNAEYYQGASIRFNSSANKLSFYTDGNNDNNPQEAMYISRTSAPTTTINILYVVSGFYLGSQDHSVQTRFLYAHRVIVNGDGDDTVPLTNSNQVLTWKNTIANGLTNNESNGNINVSVTGLYNVMACVMCKTSSAQRSVALTLKNASDVNVFSMNQHLSKHESSSSTYSMVRMNGVVRLDSSVTYHFGISCDNDGDGSIVNTDHLNNCCIIKQLPLPNGYTLASDWGTA